MLPQLPDNKSVNWSGISAARSFRSSTSKDVPLCEDLGERIEHCSFPDGKVLLWGFPDRHVNHSCDPNAYEWHEGSDIYIVARRDIAPGEEITFDYNINLTGGTPIPCNCGAERCHGVIFGDFFALPKAIQREYRPLLAHWFVRRYRHLIEALDAEP